MMSWKTLMTFSMSLRTSEEETRIRISNHTHMDLEAAT